MYLSNRYSIKEICTNFNVSKMKIMTILRKNSISRKSSKKYNYNDDIFEKIDTEEKAYWLGFLYADGYVRERKSGSELRLKLSIRDKEHLLRFKSFISEDNIPIVEEMSGNSKCVKVSINSRKIVQDLIKLGCVGKKSLIITFPKLENNLIHHFIRGYFDGDGWISTKKDNSFCFGIVSGSKSMLDAVNKIISKESEITETKIYHRSLNVNNIVYSSVTDIIKIFRFLYKESNIHLNRKMDKFTYITKYHNNHRNKNTKRWN